MAKRSRFLVALLFDARVAAEIDGLRRALGSSQLERIPPHITLVPPLNLTDDEAPQPETVVRDIAAKLDPFSLQLGPTATFVDNNGVLFLGVGTHPMLHQLRKMLHGAIPAAGARDRRPFVPHVTLVSRREDLDTTSLTSELSHYSREVSIESVSLMTQLEDQPGRPWRLVASYDLGATSLVGRGGVEIALHAGRGHSDAVASALESWGVTDLNAVPSGDGSRFVTAVLESTTVGVARWQRHEAVVELEQLIVSPEHRGVGVGTRLLDFVEGRARLSQGRLVVANLDPASDLARYVVGRGYLQMGDLAVFGDERRGFGRVLS